MRQFVVIVLAFFMGMWMIKGCQTSRQSRPVYNQNVTVASSAADGLDLQALLELAKEVSNAKELERELNKDNGINNLDLNDDGKVDFIKVSEYGGKDQGTWGFSLTTEPVAGEEQEVASIEIEKAGEQAQVEVRGNEQIYGHSHYYHNHFPIGSFLLMGYLMAPHPFYMSPWAWGYYPPYYRSYGVVNRNAYRTRTRGYTRGSTAKSAKSSSLKRSASIKNPNRGKAANSGIKKSLANPTSTQKQFRARTVKKPTSRSSTAGRSSGGFGRSSRTRRPARSYSPRGFSSSRGGGFGGGGK